MLPLQHSHAYRHSAPHHKLEHAACKRYIGDRFCVQMLWCQFHDGAEANCKASTESLKWPICSNINQHLTVAKSSSAHLTLPLQASLASGTQHHRVVCAATTYGQHCSTSSGNLYSDSSSLPRSSEQQAVRKAAG